MSGLTSSKSKALSLLAALAIHLLILGILLLSGHLGASQGVISQPSIMINLADFQESPPRRLNRPPIARNPTPPKVAPPDNLPLDSGNPPRSVAISPNASNSGSATEPINQDTPQIPTGDRLAGLADLVRSRIQSKLQYPDAARRRGVSGLVRLEIVLAPDGQAVEIRVRTSSGSAILDKAALALAGSVLPIPMAPGIAGNTSVLINVNYVLPR